jgi:hypothetical protein
MSKCYVFLFIELLTGTSVASPCLYIHKSCLELNNHSSLSAKIECNLLSEVISHGKSHSSTQLDLGYNDGMGSPEPRQLYCHLSLGQFKQDFNFYNPYWGPLIAFDLISEQQLEIRITDGWGAQETNYSFKW